MKLKSLFKSIKSINIKSTLHHLTILLICSVLFLSSTMQVVKTNADEKRKLVIASVYPVYELSKMVCGDLADVELFIPAGTDVHTYEPSAKDILKLQNADVFVYNGAGLEHWAQSIIDSLNNDKLTVVCASDAVTLLGDRVSKKTGKRKQTEAGHNRKGHFDPHTWLTPENAKLEMQEIKDNMVKADPSNAEKYEANYQEAASKFDDLQKKYEDSLKDLKSNKIVVSHEAFGYLCDQFNLEQVAIQGLEPESEPSPTRIAEIIETIKKDGIKTVFFETGESSKTSDAIAAETEASVSVLRPMEYLTAEEEAEGATLFDLFEKNLEALEKALK